MDVNVSPVRITDCFAELLSYVLSFRKSVGEKQPSYESVRQEVMRLLKQSEEFPEKGFCTREEYDQARFAVCAWIDETVLAANWNNKGRWRPELLQRVYYNSADAGEKFFQRLSSLGLQQNSIREVYFLCLTLGFVGRHWGPEGAAALSALKSQQLKLLFQGSAEVPTVAALEKTRLFPEAYLADPAAPGVSAVNRDRLFFTTVTIAGSALLLLALFLVYRFSLSGLGDNILKVAARG